MKRDNIFCIYEADLKDSEWLDKIENNIFKNNRKNIYENILKSYKNNDYFIFIGFLNDLKIGYIVGHNIHDELSIYNLAILEKYRNKDYLLLTGDPAIIGVACALVSDITNGKFNLLKWDKQERKYYSIEIDLYQKDVP